MKLAAKITPTAAIRDNGDRAGLVVTDIDLTGLTDEQRQTLASLGRNRTLFAGLPDDTAAVCGYDRGVLDRDNLVAFLDGVIAQTRANEDATKKQRDEYVASARRKVDAGELPFRSLYHEANAEIQQWPEYVALETSRRQNEVAREAAAKTAAEKAEAEKAAKAALARADMEAWIAAHGSERLRRCVAEGIECAAAYRDERLALERPGWEWDTDGEDLEPRNPPEAAFAVLDEARETAPEARLSHLVIADETDDDGDVVSEGWRGYVALAGFLGRGIRYGARR